MGIFFTAKQKEKRKNGKTVRAFIARESGEGKEKRGEEY
jgi:hypothetical protein